MVQSETILQYMYMCFHATVSKCDWYVHVVHCTGMILSAQPHMILTNINDMQQWNTIQSWTCVSLRWTPYAMMFIFRATTV